MDWLWVLLGLVILAVSWAWGLITAAPGWFWFWLLLMLALMALDNKITGALAEIENELTAINDRLRRNFPTRDEIEDEIENED